MIACCYNDLRILGLKKGKCIYLYYCCTIH